MVDPRGGGGGGGVEEKTKSRGEAWGAASRPPSTVHTHFVLSVEPLHMNRKFLRTKFFSGRASQVVVSEILAFLT